MNKHFALAGLASVLLFVASSAYAVSVPAVPGTLTLDHVGVQDTGLFGSNVVFFDVVEAASKAASQGCNKGEYFLDLNTAYGKAVYHGLLDTQIAGSHIARIDFNVVMVNGQPFCAVSLIKFAR